MRYEFHPEALAEYEEAARYYAKEQPDLEASSRLVISQLQSGFGNRDSKTKLRV
jgi:hypothetical protein